jgi:peptidyl-prolyl cis-trans isomerase A (cyclophilin A)
MRSPATLLILTLLSACGGSGERAASPQRPDTVLATRVIPPPAVTPARSPDVYRARFETSKGAFVVEVARALAPRAADRFHELVSNGYYEGTRFYRIVPGFIVQWGIHGDSTVNEQWERATFPDEPMRTPNRRGTIAFAANGPDSRAVEVFVSTGDNRRALDRQRFAPFGRVVEGMEVVERLNAEYGEEPNFSRIMRQGNSYLRRWFPALDSIVAASIVAIPTS